MEIPGGYALPYGVDSTHPAWRLVFKYQARNAVGGYAALSQNAMEYLGRQLEELSRNYDLQPCYIQLFAGTGLVGGAINQPQDGWYYIASCHVDYTEPWTGVGTVTMDVEFVNPGPPRRIGVYTAGGALSSNFSQGSTNLVAYPLNASQLASAATRTGGEGAIKVTGNPALNPQPFFQSATIADWFKGGCRVYDAMAVIGTNPVPTGGTFAHANWVEVKGPDHRFVGDVVVTNGLLLLTFTANATPIATCHLWNTALATPGWQQFATLNGQDNAGNVASLFHVAISRVGLEEIAVVLQTYTNAGGSNALLTLRLQRGSYQVRVDLRPQTAANTNLAALYLGYPSGPKIAYSGGSIADVVVSQPIGLAAQADYGYAASFIANATYPFIAGWLYQNQPANQPYVASLTAIGFGDNALPLLNATSSYGFFAIPWGSVSGATTVDKLQAEAESGAFTGAAGWASAVNAAASAGNEAKLTSGSLVGAINTFGTSYVPPAGSYRVWFRIKVTSNASALSQFKYGLYNVTDAVYMQSVTIAATAVTTAYVWYSPGAAFTPTAAKNMQFRCESTATVATDWFVDEAVLVPTTTATAYFPQDMATQFIYDRQTKIVRS